MKVTHNAVGTCTDFIDWKTGTIVHLSSQFELQAFIQLRWDDNVSDIFVHYEIDKDKLSKILKAAKQNHQLSNLSTPSIKYTNFLITQTDRTKIAIKLIKNKTALTNKEIESLWVQKLYWESKNIKFKIMSPEDINPVLVKNIRLVTEYYDKSKVFDATSAVKHLIANKTIIADIESKPINIESFIKNMKGVIS